MFPRVLIIAGSDSGGGAGIQGDIKAVTMNGAYAATAITALTAQNTKGVQGIYPVPAEFVTQQITSVLSDIGANVIKTGMLHSAAVIEAVARAVTDYEKAQLVLDPVMVATSGDPLIEVDARTSLIERLFPLATLITPNSDEASFLTGIDVQDETSAMQALEALKTMTSGAILLKGGHIKGAEITDWLWDGGQLHRMAFKRINSQDTHGTGCTLASAIAAHLANELPLPDAVNRARNYVREAIRYAPGLGQGHGPLNHAFAIREA